MFSRIMGISAIAGLCLFACDGNNPDGPTEQVTITSPTLIQSELLLGDTVTIAWKTSIAGPVISYNYHKQGSDWVTFGAASVLSSSGTGASIILPLDWYSDSFQIKVENSSGSTSIISQYYKAKYILLTSPNGDETHARGQTVNITWQASAAMQAVRVILTTDGKNWADITAQSLAPSVGAYAWTVGQEPSQSPKFVYPSTTCKVKVQEYNDGQIFDISNAVFTVN